MQKVFWGKFPDELYNIADFGLSQDSYKNKIIHLNDVKIANDMLSNDKFFKCIQKKSGDQLIKGTSFLSKD